MPDARQDRVPDGIEPIVGFRAWYVSLHGDEAHFLPLGGPVGVLGGGGFRLGHGHVPPRALDPSCSSVPRHR